MVIPPFSYMDRPRYLYPLFSSKTQSLMGYSKSNQTGHSVLTHVTGFMHYFYFPAPLEFPSDYLKPLTGYLNVG